MEGKKVKWIMKSSSTVLGLNIMGEMAGNRTNLFWYAGVLERPEQWHSLLQWMSPCLEWTTPTITMVTRLAPLALTHFVQDDIRLCSGIGQDVGHLCHLHVERGHVPQDVVACPHTCKQSVHNTCVHVMSCETCIATCPLMVHFIVG